MDRRGGLLYAATWEGWVAELVARRAAGGSRGAVLCRRSALASQCFDACHARAVNQLIEYVSGSLHDQTTVFPWRVVTRLIMVSRIRQRSSSLIFPFTLHGGLHVQFGVVCRLGAKADTF